MAYQVHLLNCASKIALCGISVANWHYFSPYHQWLF